VIDLAGLLMLLEESDDTLLIYALNGLNSVVDVFWAEISDHIPKL
jgi:hypothetical protein